MATQPTPLDRQVAEEHALHPTNRTAARAGARFGLSIGAAAIAIDVVRRVVPTDLTPPPTVRSWPSYLLGENLGLGVGVLLGVAMACIGAAVIRWRRRSTVWF